MLKKRKVWLYTNHNEEDRKAKRLLQNAKIPHENMGPSWEISTPYLKYGHWRFIGIKEIKNFIERWKNQKYLP